MQARSNPEVGVKTSINRHLEPLFIFKLRLVAPTQNPDQKSHLAFPSRDHSSSGEESSSFKESLMLHFLLRSSLIALALVACSSFFDATTKTASAQHRRTCVNCGQNHYGSPDLFYNFYAQANCGGIAAQMYTSPLPVPAFVGHTYYTYQPFMPHELLYKHTRTYHRYSDEGRGFTRTRIRWW